MSDIISWTMSNLLSIWNLMTNNSVLGNTIMLAIVSLVSGLVIHSLGNR